LVKHCTKPIDIRNAADSRVVSYCLLWRHVTGRAQNFERACNGAFCLDQSCQPEIREVRFAFCIEQNVARFDVAMENAVLVSVMNRVCDFRD
jgi:hypothetical protein